MILNGEFMRRAVTTGSICLCMLFGGCASEVKRQPSQFVQEPGGASRTVSLTKEAILLKPESGYERNIPPATAFTNVGTVPEGTVYRPVSYVLSLEGANVHEAYIVVRDGFIVGFYLPVEKAFSPLAPKVRITFVQQGEKK